MIKNTIKTAGLFSLAFGLCALVGCRGGSDLDPTSYEAIVTDLTPDLQGTTQRPIDIDANMAIVGDQNWRSFWDDMGRTFYTDRPSHLSPLPIMGTSGQPR